MIRTTTIGVAALCVLGARSNAEPTDPSLRIASVALASDTVGSALAGVGASPACIVGTSSLTIAQRDSITGGIAADSFSIESGSVVTGHGSPVLRRFGRGPLGR